MELHFVLLLVAVLLIVVSLVQRLAVRLALSASVLLAVIGLAIGGTAAAVAYLAPSSAIGGVAGRVFDLQIGSEAFLYIFLPILLFQSALGIEVREIVEDAAPILLLAVVAVVVATLVIGVALAPIAGVSIVACWMLGAIVATTDPVAVIGIFRDVGAPSRLTRLVEGESLLNDAAAIALFAVLLEIVIGGQGAGAGRVAVSFLRAFLGGIAVGAVGARLVIGLLSWLPDLRLAQVTLTLALPYLVFILGERTFSVSGVVAAVTAGLVTSAIGQPRMSPSDWRFLHELWEQLAFWASSLIFVLASVLVPRMMADASWRDALILAVLVAAALVARGLVLFGLLPALGALKLGDRVSTGFKAVILWGGLRGAVTLALALAVRENDLISADVKRFIMVQATGFVFFTLIVQGTTLRPLIRLLRLDRLTPFDQALRRHVLALSRDRVVEAVRTIGGRYGFGDTLIRGVEDQFSAPDARRSSATLRLERSAVLAVTDQDRLRLGLVALATREREIVIEHFEARTVSGRIVEEMLADVTQLIDHTRLKGRDGYLATARHMIGFSRRFRLALFFHRRLRIDGPLVDRLGDRFERLLVARIALAELAPYIEEKIAALAGRAVTPAIGLALGDRQQMTKVALEALVAQYPAYAELLERRFLTRVGLRREDMEYRSLFGEHVIGPEVYGVLQRELHAARSGVDVRPRLDLGLEIRGLIAKVPMFAALQARDLDAVAHLLRPRVSVPGETLIRRGERGDAMYFISSGAVEVHAAGQRIPLSAGNFFGEMALVMDTPRQADVLASTYCQLLVLQEADFRAMLKGRPAIKAQIDREVGLRSKMNLDAEQSRR
jgi:CPA1 family monovalent cation:H+ antiporter